MTDLFSDRMWFAVVSHPGKQELVRNELERQRYRAFLPMCRRERRNGGKAEVVIRPLFDRYLFVGCHTEQPFGPIGNTRGVAFIVRSARGVPCRVSPLALRAVKSRCDKDGGAVDLVRKPPKERWAPEQPLRVLDGPFKDFVGLFAGASGETAKVLLDMFGQLRVLSIPLQCLEPAAAPYGTAVAVQIAD